MRTKSVRYIRKYTTMTNKKQRPLSDAELIRAAEIVGLEGVFSLAEDMVHEVSKRKPLQPDDYVYSSLGTATITGIDHNPEGDQTMPTITLADPDGACTFEQPYANLSSCRKANS